MKITALGSNVAIEKMETEEETDYGIVVKTMSVPKAKIISVGEKVSMSLNVGDIVLFATAVLSSDSFINAKYLVVDEKYILAKVD